MSRTVPVVLLLASCTPEPIGVPSDPLENARTVTSTCDTWGGTYSTVVFTDEQAQNAVNFADNATATELDAVTGIGLSTATRITAGRPYATQANPVAALDAVSYVTSTVLMGLRDESLAKWCVVDDGRQGCCVDLACTGNAASPSGVVFSDDQARSVLDWANGATSSQLTAVCNVTTTVATGIVAARPVRTLSQLDAVPYVGVATLKSLKGETTCSTKPSVLGSWCASSASECTCEESEPIEIGPGRFGHDLDSDGFDDILVSAFYEGSATDWRGTLRMYRGGSTADATADLSIIGPDAGKAFGSSIAFVGDLNGDGKDDVAVGASNKVYVYYNGAVLAATLPLTSAWPVRPAGDVNGDGYDDLIVGVRNAKSAYIYFGGATFDAISDVRLTAANLGYGSSVAGAGDVNDDGYDDVIVGATSDNNSSIVGAAFVYLGGPGAFDTTADTAITGPKWGFANSVSAAGDVNADGYADLVIGSPREDSEAGAVYVHLGSATGTLAAGTRLVGARPGDLLGWSSTGAGDVNGDGYHDIAAGMPYRDSNGNASGGLYVWHGGPGTSFDRSTDKLINGSVAGRTLGWSISSADVNGDGLGDLIVGADEEFIARRGRAYVYRGTTTGLSGSAWVTLYGVQDGGYFGFAVY